AEKKNKLWIWKAYCRSTHRLLDWECGNRDSQTLQRMLCRLQRWNAKVYFADHWEAYAELIPKDLLIQTKAQTHGVERDNFRQRHWFARFRRKTCVVSRSSQMVDLTMSLYAKFWVNGTFNAITLFS
ncbi:MAG: IS1 family transposase, partial [Nitrososphaerota archaeon]|nr:IS1 family transposase [Nitrososphaerota archaeon]